MISDTTVRTMDTRDEQEISVGVWRDTVALSNTTTIPYRTIYLTATEARKLAEFLTEQADEVEAHNA